MTEPAQAQPGELPPKGPFEAAMKHLHPNCTNWTFQSDGVGGYHNHYTEMAWIAWQGGYASAALASQATPREWLEEARRLVNLCYSADDCPHRVALLAHLDSHPGAKA